MQKYAVTASEASNAVFTIYDRNLAPFKFASSFFYSVKAVKVFPS